MRRGVFSRRQLLATAPAGLLFPRQLMAQPGTGEQKFLFIYVYGGWDTSMVFTPAFDIPHTDTEPDATTAEEGGITFVDHEDRPSVRRFFEDYGHRTCVLNGMEVRSVTHERCMRILFTGNSESLSDDWPLILASNAVQPYVAPHLVMSGPAFARDYQANVVRAGPSGQLMKLLDGSATDVSDLRVELPSAEAQALEDAFMAERLSTYEAQASRGSAKRSAELYGSALQNIESLLAAGTVDLSPSSIGCRRDISVDAACAFNAFEQGVSRCALTRDDGWCSVTWDTHDNNEDQVLSYEELFGFLNQIMSDLDGRTSLSGAPLAEEVTLVVLSEMGRHPQLRGGGRDHWTFTSAMLIGAGIRGGQVIGGLNDSYEGKSVSLETGEITASGVGLIPNHLGASLLQLAGLDWHEVNAEAEPIWAALQG